MRAAATSQDMPEGCDLDDALLYEAMAYLYGRYSEKLIDLEKAKADKATILEIYERVKKS